MKAGIGFDIGGTKIAIVALDATKGTELYSKAVATPSNETDFLNTLKMLTAEVDELVGEKCPVGIGIPGVVAPDGLVKNYNNLQYITPDIKVRIEQTLSRSIALENDANCFALSESVDGAGKGYGTVFCSIFGTGVGAGTVINGKIIKGKEGIAGEWGHISQPYPLAYELEAPCSCGGFGHIEALCSAPAVLRCYNSACNVSEQVCDVREIVALARKGQDLAINTLDNLYSQMARSLAAIICILNPEVIVLGGGLSNIEEIYAIVPKRCAEFIENLMDIKIESNLKKATYGSSSGVRGAAWLGMNKISLS